ncbi:hypothetical protein M3936_13165 [Sutcliffiella horikoshii]|uniref:hypothetical protein n=1 Tax=Sutcliffiella horikoshii TaxID=79883 RepID=UPI00203F1C6D|nr:hypothetical protein [Sutcliffiella horikoshii]MCM3618533.1 hypothetical protein [Sutcliffiella horikoshii]
MMGIIAGIIFVLGIFSLFNFGFSLIYILSSTAGNGFYRWITHDLDFMLILAAPFFGVTQWAATSIYEKFNWFVARVLLVFYSVFIFIIVILCFIGFGYTLEMIYLSKLVSITSINRSI